MSAPLPLLLPIYTARLKVRFLEEEDRRSHYYLMRNPDTVRYLYEPPLSEEEANKHLQPRINSRVIEKDGDWVNFAVELVSESSMGSSSSSSNNNNDMDSERGVYIGELGLGCVSISNRSFEVGYTFLPEHCGRGYATEAVRALINYAFVSIGAHRVGGRLDARNERSGRLLERVGMRREGVLRETERVKGEWTDEAVYGVLDREWEREEGGERGGGERGERGER